MKTKYINTNIFNQYEYRQTVTSEDDEDEICNKIRIIMDRLEKAGYYLEYIKKNHILADEI